MTSRLGQFRVALRKFGPFESALAKQWGDFELLNRTGLELHAVALGLHPLYEALFGNRELEQLAAGILRQAQARADELALAPGP